MHARMPHAHTDKHATKRLFLGGTAGSVVLRHQCRGEVPLFDPPVQGVVVHPSFLDREIAWVLEVTHELFLLLCQALHLKKLRGCMHTYTAMFDIVCGLHAGMHACMYVNASAAYDEASNTLQLALLVRHGKPRDRDLPLAVFLRRYYPRGRINLHVHTCVQYIRAGRLTASPTSAFFWACAARSRGRLHSCTHERSIYIYVYIYMYNIPSSLSVVGVCALSSSARSMHAGNACMRRPIVHRPSGRLPLLSPRSFSPRPSASRACLCLCLLL